MTGRLRILLVEDNPGDARLVRAMLGESRGGPGFEVTWTDRLSKAIRELSERAQDAVLVDLSLPDSSGLDTVIEMIAAAPEVPIIVLTGTDNETLATQAVQRGTQDYLIKNQLDSELLGRTIRYAIERKQTETALRLSERRFRALTENSLDAVALFGADGKILYGSPSTRQVLGYELEEFVGRNAFEFIHPDDQALVTERLQVAMAKPREHIQVYARVRHKNGKWRWLEGVFTNLLDEPGVNAIVNNYHDFTNRKQAEDALRQSEELFSKSFYQSPIGITITRASDGVYTDANDAFLEMSGFRREELLGRTARDLNIIPSPDSRQPAPRGPGGPGGYRNVSLEITTKNGESRHVRLNGQTFNLGAVQYNLALVEDITEQKRAESALREAEAKYRTLVEQLPMIVYITPAEDLGAMTYVSPQIEDLLGYSAESWTRDTRFWRQILHPDDRERVLAEVERVNASREPFKMEYRMVAGDGRVVWLRDRSRLVMDKQGDPQFWQGLMIDISETKQAQAALQAAHDELEVQVQERTAALTEANALLQTLMDNMPDHIYFKDAQSRFIRNSRSQAKMMGLDDPAGAVGKSDFDFFPQAHAQRSFDEEQQLIESGQALVNFEERVVWPDGRLTYVSTTKLPLRAKDGAVIGTFGISRDITQRKAAEQALQIANSKLEAANKELEAFAYSVSHDLRAPLRAIDGFSSIVMEEHAAHLPPETQRYLSLIRKNTQQMGMLIDDLLAFSRLGRHPLNLQEVAPAALLKQVIEDLLLHEKSRRVDWVLGDLPACRADPALLRQVFVNLLSNALKYTRQREVTRIEVGALNGDRPDSGPTYFVKDNGVGFQMEYYEKLFGVFQRLHRAEDYEGTGVGLAIVQRIVHRHGGQVWAEAEVDQGATFYFTLGGNPQ
jgi:PAS domain S-box-containing protein